MVFITASKTMKSTMMSTTAAKSGTKVLAQEVIQTIISKIIQLDFLQVPIVITSIHSIISDVGDITSK